MRYHEIISKPLAETLFTRAHIYGHEVRIFKNPSVAEFTRVIEKSTHHYLRGMLTPTDLYVWDAGLADHGPIVYGVGIEGKRIELSEEDVYRYPEPDDKAFYYSHPILRRLFGSEFHLGVLDRGGGYKPN